MKKVLFVCLGNICRSPAAEAIFAQKAEKSGLLVICDSAGTGNWHVGDQPYQAMVEAAGERGYDLSTLRARQVTREDFLNFDLIVTMDDNNKRDVEAIRPHGNKTPVRAMLSYTPTTGIVGASTGEVPDPYYTRNFDEALDLIEAAADALVGTLKS